MVFVPGFVKRITIVNGSSVIPVFFALWTLAKTEHTAHP